MKLLKQILDSVASKTFSVRSCSFENIVGNADTKLILNKAILSRKPVHVLLVGEPGCAKTMFLTEMMRSLKNSYFIIGSNTTKAGLVNQLFEKEPKYLLIDELDKMSGKDQVSLLHLMETGIISETKVKKTRELKLVSWVFASANSSDRMIEPLLSRFVVLEVPDYSFEEFTDIAIKRLANEKIDLYIATIIAEKVWHELGSRDIRDVIKVGRLANDTQSVSNVIDIIKKHTCNR
ncbi:MAG TPA: AAA family ATPase [Nitrososphaeraceae archaeon]